MNYKSLECYQHFTAGWVREILVMLEGEKDLTAKVRRTRPVLYVVSLYWYINVYFRLIFLKG